MPVQFQGVAVHALPGSREGRPDGLHPLLEAATPPLEDPEPDIGPRLPEKREVNPEPVVVPRCGTPLTEEFLQPFLAVGGQPVDLQRPAARAGPRRAVQAGRGPRPGWGAGPGRRGRLRTAGG